MFCNCISTIQVKGSPSSFGAGLGMPSSQGASSNGISPLQAQPEQVYPGSSLQGRVREEDPSQAIQKAEEILSDMAFCLGMERKQERFKRIHNLSAFPDATPEMQRSMEEQKQVARIELQEEHNKMRGLFQTALQDWRLHGPKSQLRFVGNR